MNEANKSKKENGKSQKTSAENPPEPNQKPRPNENNPYIHIDNEIIISDPFFMSSTNREL